MAKLPSGDDLRRAFYDCTGMTMDEFEDELTIEELASGIAAYAVMHDISPFEAYTAVGVALAVATGLVEFTGREE